MIFPAYPLARGRKIARQIIVLARFPDAELHPISLENASADAERLQFPM